MTPHAWLPCPTCLGVGMKTANQMTADIMKSTDYHNYSFDCPDCEGTGVKHPVLAESEWIANEEEE